MSLGVQVIAFVLIVGGVFFMLVAAVGVVRLPDLPTRMHAATKAGTLGAGLLLVATTLVFQDLSVTTRALVTIVFLLLTAPVAAHAMGRAGYYSGVRIVTRLDELKARLDEEEAGERDVEPPPTATPGSR